MDQKDLRNTTKKERIAVAVLLAAILLLYAFFLKDILIPFLKLEARHDLHGANELLLSKGIFGSLQMGVQKKQIYNRYFFNIDGSWSYS